MKFKGFNKSSLIEYPEKIVSVVFTGGCNFRCPFCHNKDLVLNPDKIPDITEKEIIDYIEKKRKWIDGIAITGGEPTLHKELPAFIKRIKDKGFLVELETNGTNPEMIKQLIDDNLVDYLAMDIKAPLEEKKYYQVIGKSGDKKKILDNIKKTINIIQKSGVDYEFRTTFVPGLLTKEDIYAIAEQLKGSKRYVIQKFLPNNNIDPEYEKKDTLKPGFFEEFKEKLKDYFDEIIIKA
ncbi:anaerobic ribonucleoside-triphosphate reductase activating protein [Candidatus Woesearchaeota archaeon]|nr:anaerobic ribonucleoside-triphosphate reductase activating protein [Candidatus Woesearchaeota archaeon]